jgi:hypothetical protein
MFTAAPDPATDHTKDQEPHSPVLVEERHQSRDQTLRLRECRNVYDSIEMSTVPGRQQLANPCSDLPMRQLHCQSRVVNETGLTQLFGRIDIANDNFMPIASCTGNSIEFTGSQERPV